MESELFTWTGWDLQDTAAFMFYGPIVLKVDVADLKAGSVFYSAFVDYENGILEFYSQGEDEPAPAGRFKMKLTLTRDETP